MGEVLLEVRDVHVEFPAEHSVLNRVRGQAREVLTAVDGVSLRVRRGEALGLVGESGCGKSTLARTIVGLYQPTSGEILFDGVRLERERPTSLRRRIQMVFQDPYSSLNPRMTVEQAIQEMLRVHRMVPRQRVEARALELLHLVGLGSELRHVYPRQLSGGQRQRVSIARALALEPDILIADEPVSALDVSVQATVLNVLMDLREQLGLTLILIAHNLAVVQHLCNRVHIMYLGRIVEVADTGDVFRDPRHPYTQGLMHAAPSILPGQRSSAVAVVGDPPSPYHLPSGCRFHPRCPLAQDVCVTVDPPLLSGPLMPAHTAACHFAWPPHPQAHTPLAAQTLASESDAERGMS